MTLGGYTHDRYGGVGRANFRTERELFDFVFKTAQAEAMFTDYPDRVVDYLIRNNMRDGRIPGLPYIGPEYVYRPKVAAHRGASGYLPEHTLEGFAYAYGLGADLLEPDVQITRDGVPIVLHDPTLQRTTNVHDVFPGRHRSINDQGVHQYYAGDFTWAEIKQLTVTESIIRGGSNDGRPTYPDRFPIGPEYDYGVPFRILSLEELIRLTQGLNFAMQRDVGIYPETKHDIHNDNIEPVIDLLIEFGYNHPVGSDRPGGEALLQSFQPRHIIRARNDYGWVGPTVVLPTSFFLLDSGADILMTQEGVKEIAKYADFYAPTISNLFDFSDFGWIPHDRVQWARDAGMGIHTWTHRTDDWTRTPTANVQVRFTEEQLLDALFKVIRLDGIFTDFPDVVIGYLYDNNMRGVSARPTRKHYVITAGSVAGANGTVAVSTGAANVTTMTNAVDGASGYTVLYEDGFTLTLTLTATPNAGYRFDGWFENDVRIADAGAVYTFTATAENRMLEARFIPDGDSNSGCNAITNAFGALLLLSLSALWIRAKS
jgi:glycerophosphoryl diester phosphodiesterase